MARSIDRFAALIRSRFSRASRKKPAMVREQALGIFEIYGGVLGQEYENPHRLWLLDHETDQHEPLARCGLLQHRRGGRWHHVPAGPEERRLRVSWRRIDLPRR